MSWCKTDLQDVIAAIQSGSRPKGGASTDSGEVMSLGGKNILQQGGVELRDIKRVPIDFFMAMTKGHLRDGDVLINKDGANTGKVGLFRETGEGPACINEHLFLLRGDASKITQEYLYYTLLSEPGQTIIRNRISGSAQPGLKSSFINNFWIELPQSIDEQNEIARILQQLDRAIEQTEALIAKQQRIKTGLMQELLTKGIDEHCNIRSEATHAFKDSPLGRIPMEWEAKILDGCVRPEAPICYGILMPGTGVNDGVPVIKVKDIFDGAICLKDILLTDPKIDAAYKRSRLRQGDLLMTIRGTTGRIAVVPPVLDAANITQDTARIRLKDECLPSYFYYLLQSVGVQAQVDLQTMGQAVKGINIAEVRKLRVPVPITDEQERIHRILDHIHSVWQTSVDSREKLIRQKCGLMSDLLTGNRRVTPLLAQTGPVAMISA